MKKKIIIAGGTGFIGRYLSERFRQIGYEVIVISRKSGDVQWNNLASIAVALESAVLVINLAGKSVDCRYTEENKSAIFSSRIETTKILGNAIENCKNPPTLWLNSSTATIYRNAADRPMTEDDGEIGQGFSVNVAKSWEKAFFDFQLKSTRQIALRMAIVLGRNGGVIKPFLNLVRFGLGGKQGNGRQMFSWIHIADVFDIISFLMKSPQLSGVYNCSSPNPVTNETLMRTFREVTHTGFGLPSPVWLLKIGAVVIKTETELILKSRWVTPSKLLKEGYVFQFPNLYGALEEIITANDSSQSKSESQAL